MESNKTQLEVPKQQMAPDNSSQQSHYFLYQHHYNFLLNDFSLLNLLAKTLRLDLAAVE